MASAAPQGVDSKGRLSHEERNEPRPYNLESRISLPTARLSGPAGQLVLSNSNTPTASQLILAKSNVAPSPPSQLILTNSNPPATSQLSSNALSTKTVGARSVPFNKKKKPDPPQVPISVRIQIQSNRFCYLFLVQRENKHLWFVVLVHMLLHSQRH